MRTAASVLISLALSSHAMAGSIQAPGVIGGADSGPTSGNPAATMYNPAALRLAEGMQAMLDVQLASIGIDVTSWRNGGFDPNTGEPYTTAKARVKAPVTFLGLSYELPARTTLGLGVVTPFIGGGDYTAGEDNPPPYTSHQRYFGINTKVITGQVIPAIGYTPVEDWGLHLGAGMTYTLDIIQVTKASNTGFEGLQSNGTGPYSTDAILTGEAQGSHLGWNVGLMFDKYKMAQLGASYTSAGTFHAEGDAEVKFPSALVAGDGGKTVKGDVEVNLNLPAIIRVGLNSQVTDKLNLGGSWEHFRWHDCCGDKDGDIDIKLQDENGNAVGDSDDDVQIGVAKQQFSPRRLMDANNVAMFSGFQHSDALWFGGRVSYNQNAVPDYAVGATNLDFENAGFMLATKYRFALNEKKSKGLTLGLAYSKFFLFTRRVSGTAWGADVPDARFSPADPPVNVSGDGIYEGKVDIFGFRLAYDG
jgi:long-subunit fatty acid transport protein